MVSPKQLVSTVESCLNNPSPPSPAQRMELLHAIRSSLPSLQSLLSYPPPKPADRTQVQSKEVRLPDSPPFSLDDQDVNIILKLSDDFYLNEIECVRLLVSANQEWGLMGREPQEILRLAAGLWYTERHDLIMALYTLLRAVVLDQTLEDDLVADIQKHLEELIEGGLRQRLISLIKELNREEPAGLGGPSGERFVLDSRGALVERRDVVYRERLTLGHCLVLSVLVVRTSPKDVKDILSTLKDNAAELVENNDIIKRQITFSLLFSLLIGFISDALSAVPDKAAILSRDTHFRKEFHETVMAAGNNQNVEGFVGGVRLAWSIHLMLINDGEPTTSSNDFGYLKSCLEVIFLHNVFQFLLDNILRTAAYQNDDEDIIYIYNAYLHKMITCFLSHQLAMDKIKESKEKAMTVLNSYRSAPIQDFVHESDLHPQHTNESRSLVFVSLLDFVSGIYQREQELLSGNDVLWTFVNFAGEDHTNFQTLVAFLKMLSTLASSQEGAAKVYELLRGKAFRSVGWTTLFECLTIYDEKFKQALQTAGAMLPEFQEGDAKALVAYLNVLQKVIENGNPDERNNWFPDIEPLFKLLSYENVPPYLKGALRNAIAAFINVSPGMKNTIWSYLEQYDLPVVVGPQGGNGTQPVATQVYDMRYELNEVEARREQYPSTISFLNLLNALIAEEKDKSDRGRRFIGIFRFVYDHVFGPFPQRAYADPCEKWQLVVACLQHFHMMLSMYDIQDEDIDSVIDQLSAVAQPSSLQMQLPVLELLKDFMSGKTVFRNVMGILMPGVNAIITERTTQVHGQLLEKAVQLSLEIINLVFEKDVAVSDYWRPLYQPLDVILSQDHNQIMVLLEYVRYEFLPKIQQCSIKIMSILSSRMVELVPLLLKSGVAGCLIEDYATCLELRSEESHTIENSDDDPGVLIMQLLIGNIGRPAPNITHLLLKFDLDTPVERTVLQPKFHYSCLKVILETLEKLSRPDINAMLHEFGFQLIYELCLDPLTCGPTMDLLSKKKYQFFVKHLDTIGVAPLPKRNSNQPLRISSLHQRAWLLKLLAVEMHCGHEGSSTHQETCKSILAHLFGRDIVDIGSYAIGPDPFALQNSTGHIGTQTIIKSKVLELLEVIQFKAPDTTMKLSQIISNTKYDLLAEDILGDSTSSEKGGIYYYSERGDRLIDLASLRDKLWQKISSVYPQLSNFGNEAELSDVREMIQKLLRWGWKYNKNLEEQAAQLHMLAGWSQIIEVSATRRLSLLENRSEILYQILDASLSAASSPDCSLRMALILIQVALTCMAKLRDERFLYPGGVNSDSITCLDVIWAKQLSNGACHAILFKLIMAILRNESSEALRRRQYALLLSYFQYCQHMLDPDIPTTVLQFLLRNEESEDLDLQKIDSEQAELARANFLILKKEAQAILDLVIKDAAHGSEPAKTMALYVLDALICIDHERFFLTQLQSRGFLRSCLVSISSTSFQEGAHSLDSSQRAYTLEAELALLLRVSHKYGKSGAQVLSSMGALEHIASCRAVSLQGRRLDTRLLRHDVALDINKQRMVLTPVLRFVFSLTSLVDTSDIFEVKNKIVREVIGFVKGHQLLFDQILREDVAEADELTMEHINLVVGILSKVWPYEESDEFGFVQGLFYLMRVMFSSESEITAFDRSLQSHEGKKKSELTSFRLCFGLSSYLYFLVTKKSLRLQVTEGSGDQHFGVAFQQPTLLSLSYLLGLVTTALERAADEKCLLLNKLRDINELSRQEVDEIINMFVQRDSISSLDDIQKRRYIAMMEMSQVAGNRHQLITLLLTLAEHVLNILLVHLQDREDMQTIRYGAKFESEQDVSGLCGNLLPTLERLEQLNEEKIGHSLRVFRRLVTALKETTIQKLAV